MSRYDAQQRTEDGGGLKRTGMSASQSCTCISFLFYIWELCGLSGEWILNEPESSIHPKLCSQEKSVEHFILSFIREWGKYYQKNIPKEFSIHDKIKWNYEWKITIVLKNPPPEMETSIHFLYLPIPTPLIPVAVRSSTECSVLLSLGFSSGSSLSSHHRQHCNHNRTIWPSDQLLHCIVVQLKYLELYSYCR